MSQDTIPDFANWATSRLKFLLVEYTESLPAQRVLYGRKHPEVVLHEQWIEAIQKELDKRDG